MEENNSKQQELVNDEFLDQPFENPFSQQQEIQEDQNQNQKEEEETNFLHKFEEQEQSQKLMSTSYRAQQQIEQQPQFHKIKEQSFLKLEELLAADLEKHEPKNKKIESTSFVRGRGRPKKDEQLNPDFIPFQSDWVSSIQIPSVNASEEARLKYIIDVFAAIDEKSDFKMNPDDSRYYIMEDLKNIIALYKINKEMFLNENFDYNKKDLIQQLIDNVDTFRSYIALGERYDKVYRNLKIEKLEILLEQLQEKGIGGSLKLKRMNDFYTVHYVIGDQLIRQRDLIFKTKKLVYQKHLKKDYNDYDDQLVYYSDNSDGSFDENSESIEQRKIVLKKRKRKFPLIRQDRNNPYFKVEYDYPNDNNIQEITFGTTESEEDLKMYLQGNKSYYWTDVEDKVLLKTPCYSDKGATFLLYKYKGQENILKRIDFLISKLKETKDIILNSNQLN